MTDTQDDTPDRIPEIDVAGARQCLDAGSALFLDVRDPQSYGAAHVPGALHLTDGNIEDFLQETDRGQPLIVYCYHGHTSLGGAAFLLSNGFKDVRSMAGGFEAWRGRHPQEPAR